MKLENFRFPWWFVADEEFSAQTTAAFEAEAGPSQRLKMKELRALADRIDCDDVLFLVLDEPSSTSRIQENLGRIIPCQKLFFLDYSMSARRSSGRMAMHQPPYDEGMAQLGMTYWYCAGHADLGCSWVWNILADGKFNLTHVTIR